jgi:hypothetical protein
MVRLRSPEPTLKDLLPTDDCRDSPDEEAERGKYDVRTGGCAYGAAAEQERGQEDSERDEAAEVEERVDEFDGEAGVWMRCCN